MEFDEKKSPENMIPAGNNTGEEILNSLTVITGIAQLVIRKKHPAEWLLMEKEIEKISFLVRSYFGLHVRG